MNLRKRIVEMIYRAKEGHIPSAFSIVDIIEVLYERVLKPEDRFILSKGHGCAALYAVLGSLGRLRDFDLERYGSYEGILGGHPDRTKAPVECSTGSLGHGLPMAVGLALGLKIQKKPGRVYCLVGDGECHEGTTWESARVAAKLDLPLTVIVDDNGSAEQLIPHSNLALQFLEFDWTVWEIDGHDKEELADVLPDHKGCDAVIANTVKGKGCKRMETHGPWHHKIPNAKEYAEIMAELDATGVR